MAKRARGQEVVRQWRLLLKIEAARLGLTIKQLADEFGVTQRTIRRDIEQLQEVGFPLEQKITETRRAWMLNRDAFKGLTNSGLTLSELCALYLSRALAEYLAGTPFRRDLASAFEKFEDCLTPAQKLYFDDFPKVLAAKPEPRKKAGTDSAAHVGRLTTAALEHRRVQMTYHSFRSRKVKPYIVEPYQVYYAQGGLYLFAVVPEYGEIRQFAIERIKSLKMTEDHFEPNERVDLDRHADSFGVNLGGKPETVSIEFQPEAALYVSEREYHPSQQLTTRDDGSLVLTMRVVVDWALGAWVLGFGSSARVLKPRRLAERVLEQVDEMRAIYAPPLPGLPKAPAPRGQKGLPFTR
jgi:predicted DNA-binding transcriptional regulator YafY